MPTNPTRIPDQTHREVSTAAHLLGCTPGELLQRAWECYQQTPEFKDDFTVAQRAFQSKDLELLASHLDERARQRASGRAAAVRARRRS